MMLIIGLRKNLRSRTRGFLKGRNASAVADLGCSLDEFKVHLETQFQSGMSWDNYGPKGWHIDHIKPLSKYVLSDREVYLQLIHYTNLSPKWWYDNIAKSNKEI